MNAKSIICVQCGNVFEFSAQEQEKFRQRGFDDPKRCNNCRKKKAKEPSTAFSGKPDTRRDSKRRHRSESRKNREYWE